MQKVQILRGTPEPTFLLTTAAAARFLATERYMKGNLVVNGDMEANSNWADTTSAPALNEQSTTKVITGDYSRKFTPDAVNEGIQSDVFTKATVTGQRYYYTFRVFPDDDDKVSVIIRKGDNSGNLYDESITGLTENAWNEVKIDVTEEAGGALGYIIFHSGATTSGDWYIANVYGSPVNQAGVHTGRKATRMFITVEADEMLWTTGGVDPVQEGLGHKIWPASATAHRDQIILENFDAIKTFRYITHDGANHAKLYVNMEF